ncbi:MAG: FAD-dependent oxidoreductase [Planctomycetes bacterium]|nr:FAD-dependent oxidoreductase [Planctomycetota bacterium]
MAGAAAAARLQEAGLPVLVLDKGRGPGGRCSTRRGADAGRPSFDHGAQYFTARGPRLQELVARWSASGGVQPWTGPYLRKSGEVLEEELPSTTRWVGVPGMNQVPRLLLGGAPTRYGARVTRLLPGGRLELQEGAEVLGPFRLVLLTLPPSQALELVRASEVLAPLARAAEMVPCITWMVQLEQGPARPFSGLRAPAEPVSWIARDSSKPGRGGGEAWVLQLSPEASAEVLEDGEEAWRRLCEPALAAALGAPPRIVHSAFHRWRFAQRAEGTDLGPAPEPLDLEHGWGLAGDWLRGGRLEAAFDSGTALAERVVAALS